MFIQYWLIKYSGTCPSGWNSYSGDCYKNSSAASLVSLGLTGQATSGRNDDTFIVQISSTLYSLQNQDSGSRRGSGWNLGWRSLRVFQPT
jgi:hypothetical protein